MLEESLLRFLSRDRGKVRAYGAGLLSSYGELSGFEQRAELRPFDPDAIAQTPYDPTDYQKTLFVADSFAELCGRTAQYLSG